MSHTVEQEVWRAVSGHEGRYEVSNLGRVRSLWFVNGNANQARKQPLILTPYYNTLGYGSVTICKGGRKVTEHLHTLVLRAFVGPRPEGHVGGHRDGNPSNNKLSNLDWITFVENEADKRRHGRNLPGSKNHQAKLTESSVIQMRQMYARGGLRLDDLGFLFGVSRPVAHKIVRCRAWRHV